MSAPLAPEFRLAGRYTLETRLAVGGMGEVWRARDEVLGRTVAVKVLKAEYAADPEFLERFRNEARHTAALSHPGIANVFDYGEAGDTAYLVMEHVAGEPLSTVIAREGRLPPERALDVVGQAALALQAAHAAGVIHRDVKPGNILIRPDGVVKVTDFGIARAVDTAPVTRTGMVVGTAAYLSPEQAAGRPAGPASDIYSLGVVTYECLTGSRPFTADSAVGVAMAHINEPAPPLPADVPPVVGAFVAQALDKDPARRPADAGDFGRTALALAGSVRSGAGGDTKVLTAVPPEVEAAAAPSPEPTFDEHTRRRVRNTFIAIGAAVVIAGFLVLRACTGTTYATVPKVTGDTFRQAAAALGRVDLDARRHVVHDPAHHAGTVLRQSARPGSRLATGTTVTLTVASGPRLVTVAAKRYVGEQVDTVRKALAALNLKTRTTSQVSDAQPGTVIAVDPTGSVREGSTVTLTVAAQPPPPPREDKRGHGKHGHDD